MSILDNMEYGKHDFTVWDYTVFVVLLTISSAIGVYFAYQGRRQNTTNEFLMAGIIPSRL